MNKKLFLAIIILCFSISANAQQQDVQKIPVEVIEVKKQPISVMQDLPGRVSAFRSAEVRARVSGIIEKRVFVEGSEVSEGDILFHIEDKSYKAEFDARKADLANAQAVYNLSVDTKKRYQKLLESGYVSQQEYDTYASQVEQARARLEQAKSNVEIAQINYQYATVKAPISGRIDKALVTEGALTSAGTTQLARIDQLDKVYVDFTRSSSEFQRLRRAAEKEGNTASSDNLVEIFFDDGSSFPEKGTLEFSSMSVDSDTGNVSLRAVVENVDNLLLPGMYVRVNVIVGQSDGSVTIPQKAVIVGPNGTAVHMVQDDKIISVPVTVGEMKDNNWIIKGGLNDGDRVVVGDVSAAQMSGMPVVGLTAEEMQGAQQNAEADQ